MWGVPIDHLGITLRRITQVNGSTEFCEEFFDDGDVGDYAELARQSGQTDSARVREMAGPVGCRSSRCVRPRHAERRLVPMQPRCGD